MARLASEVAQLRREANYLRSRLPEGRHTRILRRSLDDASTILKHSHAGLPTSRRWLASAGVMSERRYAWAMGLIRLARLDGAQLDTLEDLQMALQRLNRKYASLRDSDDTELIALRSRMAKPFRLWRVRDYEKRRAA